MGTCNDRGRRYAVRIVRALGLFAWRSRLYRQRMDALMQQIGQRMVHRALPRHPALTDEGRALDLDREVAFARSVMAGMAAMPLAVVDHRKMAGIQCLGQAADDFGGDGAGGKFAHGHYIDALNAKRRGLSEEFVTRRAGPRFHGRIDGKGQPCAEPGCEAPGEFRAPVIGGRRPGFDGPGDWRYLCLDHVRAFNNRYNFFDGMSTDEIEAEQTPYGGWDRETRAFSPNAGSAPRWADFTDPLDAIGARFARAEARERADGRELSESDRKALKLLGLGKDADRRALRTRYAELVRRYHPDRNGGDRSHEKALQDVISAYTQLKGRPAFA